MPQEKAIPRNPLTEVSIRGSNRIARLLWTAAYVFLYRITPNAFHPWRCMILRVFGAKIGMGVHPYPRARIWAPWNLVMQDGSCLANDVDCYNVALVTLGPRSTVSQYSYLCTASHDYRERRMPLVAAPIEIGADAWVAADSFVGPGVRIGTGAVVAARSTLLQSVDEWMVVGGHPAKTIKTRQPFQG